LLTIQQNQTSLWLICEYDLLKAHVKMREPPWNNTGQSMGVEFVEIHCNRSVTVAAPKLHYN
jgi:hypothetical protein